MVCPQNGTAVLKGFCGDSSIAEKYTMVTKQSHGIIALLCKQSRRCNAIILLILIVSYWMRQALNILYYCCCSSHLLRLLFTNIIVNRENRDENNSRGAGALARKMRKLRKQTTSTGKHDASHLRDTRRFPPKKYLVQERRGS